MFSERTVPVDEFFRRTTGTEPKSQRQRLMQEFDAYQGERKLESAKHWNYRQWGSLRKSRPYTRPEV